MQRLLVSGMSMNNITFLCSLSLRNYLVNYATLTSIWHVHEEQIIVLFLSTYCLVNYATLTSIWYVRE